MTAISTTTLSSDTMYRMLVQSVTDYAIYMLDPYGHVVNWNAGAQRVKGYRAEDIIGRHFSCFFTAEDNARNLPQLTLAEALATQRCEGEGWRLRRDGSRFWAHVITQPVRDEEWQAGRLCAYQPGSERAEAAKRPAMRPRPQSRPGAREHVAGPVAVRCR